MVTGLGSTEELHDASSFDAVVDRRASDSIKWSLFDEDVLPMWVADMDFPSPPAVIDALRARVDHGVFGYSAEPPELREIFVARLNERYGWHVEPESLVFLPNVAVAFNLACQAVAHPGNGLLIQPPIYFPILRVPENASLKTRFNGLVRAASGQYEIDFDAFETEAKRSRVFLLCNPHNPVSRVFSEEELERMAEICLRHDVIVCSDEIHADFVFNGRRHVPIASLSPEMEERAITLFAPNKTFNIAGIPSAIAVVPNESYRRALGEARRGLLPHVSVMGYTAALAAFKYGDPWLTKLIAYLESNRAILERFVAERVPQTRLTPIEGTYLAWLDCRGATDENPHEFLLREGRIALNDGATFGPGGEGFVRLNFACPQETLLEGLGRIAHALGRR